MAQKTQYSTKHATLSRSHSNRWLWLAGGVLIVAAAICVLELTNTTHFFHKEKAVSSTIAPATKTTGTGSSAKDQNSSTSSGSAASTSTAVGAKDSSPTNPSAALVAPYGNFVSNHHPGANGSPSTETSVCMTTPGAKCQIRFVSQEDPTVVKTLSAGTADTTGAVYWNNWDVKDAGFTNGTWNIQVVATLGDQTLTTTDKLTFQVGL